MNELCASADNLVDVTVVGAGVVGIATAYAAAHRGLTVRVVDRAPGPALGASLANGAQLSYAYTEAMASPSLWSKLPAIALGLDRALSLRWSLDPDFLRWGIAFLRNSTAARFHANTLAVLELATQSRAAMDALLARHPIEFSHTAPGKMHLYYDRQALDAAAAMVAVKHKYGVEQAVLDARAATALEPALAGASGLAGVVHSPRDEVGDPHQFCAEMMGILQTHYAVDLQLGTEVIGLDMASDEVRIQARDGRSLRSRSFVLCPGADAAVMGRWIGVRLPVMPVKGYSFTADPGTDAPRVSITDTARKLVFCRLGDKMRVAGLAQVGHRDPTVQPQAAQRLLAMARESLPRAVAYDGIDSDWAGLRPMTPSSVPIIRRARPNIVVNIGHGMLGWTLAMGAGERAVMCLLERRGGLESDLAPR